MKRIAYIEIDTHAEIAQSFIDVTEGMTDFLIDFYVSKKIKDQIKETNASIHLSDSSMILEQLKTESYDLVIIGTVHRYFNTFLTITEKYNSAIIVHNLNFSKTSKLNLLKSILKSDTIYRLKLLAKEGLLNVSKVYKQTNNFLVLDEEMSNNTVMYLPLFFTKNIDFKTDETLKIVIPGGVSQQRRDYQKVILKIKEIDDYLRKNELKKQLEFVFLGKAKDAELHNLEHLEKSLHCISIHYFKERVSSEIFNQKMSEADFLWCPIQDKTEFFSQAEIYGKTKMTGNLGDAISFGKIAIFPENYQSKQGFIIPEKREILTQFEDLKNNTFNFEKEYSKDVVQEKLRHVFEKLLAI